MGEHLRPVEERKLRRIDDLIARLDHDEFTERERASEELEKLGPRAVVALRREAQSPRSPEALQRLRPLLQRIGPPFRQFPNAVLRSLRAIRVLELVASEESKGILRNLATGSPWSLQTREAEAVLERLEAGQKSE